MLGSRIIWYTPSKHLGYWSIRPCLPFMVCSWDSVTLLGLMVCFWIEKLNDNSFSSVEVRMPRFAGPGVSVTEGRECVLFSGRTRC